MNVRLRLRQFISNQTITNIKRILAISISATPLSSPNHLPYRINHHNPHLGCPPFLIKTFHSTPMLNQSHDDDQDDAAINEFLSRFVYIMRGKLGEAYPGCDKPTLDSMLIVIVEKLMTEMEKGGNLEENLTAASDDDLWRTVWEVCNNVYQEMEREKNKEKLKMFLQSDDVKAMTRFASEVGVRGDELHELRFKWAREEMEKAQFLDNLSKSVEAKVDPEGNVDGFGGLPKRHGKIKYKLYGLDLSDSRWRKVAENIHEASDVIEAKPISGKCRLVTQKILGLGSNDDYESVISPLLNEWKELLQPNRVDWISLLDKLKERDSSLYLKVAEHVLDEPSFQASIRDYSKLIDAYSEEIRIEDMERILKKMTESGMTPDVITLVTLLHTYSKTNNSEQAQGAYERLISQGFKPDKDVYKSMIMVHVNDGQPKKAEAIMRKMELRDIKPTQQIYMAILQAFAKNGDIIGAKRIVTSMQFSGFQPNQESCTLLIEACGKSGNSDEARSNFDYMMKLGFKPDDRSISLVISAYMIKNELDRALSLLLKLEKDGYEPGVSTYSVLVDWMCKLQLVDEAEQILAKIAQLGEAPPFKIQVSLCEMYARAGIEKKTLQALGILEAKKDLLQKKDFERIIPALMKGGFMQDAQRMQEVMKSQRFIPPESFHIDMMTSQFGNTSGSRLGMS